MKKKINPLSSIDIMNDNFYKYIREYEQEKQFDFNIFNEVAFNNYIENFKHDFQEEDTDSYSFYDEDDDIFSDIDSESEIDD
tara:strand:+ start:216 stop:461 length:246 start_codon:yes stop_codon:yes gene_type:complete